MGLPKLSAGIASIAIPGGLLELGQSCHKSISDKLESTMPLRVLVMAIHGWGPLDSRDEDCSMEMALRLENQMRSFFDPVLVTTMPVCSSGTTDERAEKCTMELSSHPRKLDDCDLLMVVGHSQGGVVGMKVLQKLLDAGKLEGKRAGILTLAGVHGGTFEPISNPLRAATTELSLLSRPHDQVSVAYRETVLRVLNAGIQVIAIHSFGDNLVNITSSTLGFLGERSPHNLCLGMYLSKSHGSELSSTSERWVPRLYQMYLRARNIGFMWHPSFGTILDEADPFSKLAVNTYPLQMAFNWATRGYPSVQISDSHSELVSCDALYLYATLWMTADTSTHARKLSLECSNSLGFYSDTLDFILSELNRAELFDSCLTPYTQPIRGELMLFRNDLKAKLPDLFNRPSYLFYSRMARLFSEMSKRAE